MSQSSYPIKSEQPKSLLSSLVQQPQAVQQDLPLTRVLWTSWLNGRVSWRSVFNPIFYPVNNQVYLAIESLLSCSLIYNQTLLNHCYINEHIAASLLWVECITPSLTVVLPFRGTSTGWWESHEVQQEVQSPAPEEEQPQAPVCAGGQWTGKMLGKKKQPWGSWWSPFSSTGYFSLFASSEETMIKSQRGV